MTNPKYKMLTVSREVLPITNHRTKSEGTTKQNE